MISLSIVHASVVNRDHSRPEGSNPQIADNEASLRRILEAQKNSTTYGVVTFNLHHPNLLDFDEIVDAVQQTMLAVDKHYKNAPIPVALGKVRTPELDGVKEPRVQIVFAQRGNSKIQDEIIALMVTSLNKAGFKAGIEANSSKVASTLESKTSEWGSGYGDSENMSPIKFEIRELAAMVNSKVYERNILWRRGKNRSGSYPGYKFEIGDYFSTWHTFGSEILLLHSKEVHENSRYRKRTSQPQSRQNKSRNKHTR